MGFATWSDASTAARDRAGWKRQVNGPIPPSPRGDVGKKSSKSYSGKEDNLTTTLCFEYFLSGISIPLDFPSDLVSVTWFAYIANAAICGYFLGFTETLE